jgi:hypothetical protein
VKSRHLPVNADLLFGLGGKVFAYGQAGAIPSRDFSAR